MAVKKSPAAPAGTPDQFKGPFGGIDEAAVHEWLENRVGINKAFALMRIWERCSHSSLSRPEQEKRFREAANRDGYEEKVIEHYLTYIA